MRIIRIQKPESHKLLPLSLVCLSFAANAFAGVREDFLSRMPTLKAAIPTITAAAEACSERLWENPKANITIPLHEGFGFREEMIGRAGGLARIGGWWPRQNGVVLFAVRDWERFADRAEWLVDRWSKEGNIVVVFGSANGKPANLAVDFFIDNGAPDGSGGHGSVNALANATLGWMWCCEYAAAFSRNHGKFPAITKSIGPVDSWGLNAANNAPDGGMQYFDCPEKIQAGELALVYWHRVLKLLSDMAEPCVTIQIRKAASIVVDKMAEGRRVGIAGLGHLILEEPKHGLKSPMIGFRSVSMIPVALESVLGPGDLLVWMSYSGMNSTWDDYAAPIVAAGVDLIVSFAQPEPAEPTSSYLCFIPQSWSLPDAEVSIPVPPGAMAPVSEIDRVLLTRMLDEEVCLEIERRKLEIKRPDLYDPLPFYDYGQRSKMTDAAPFDMPNPEDVILTNAAGTYVAAGPLHYPPSHEAAKPQPPRRARIGKDRTIAMTNGLWGVIGDDGNWRIPAEYENILSLGDKFAAVIKNRKYGVMDWSGNVVVPIGYGMINNRCGVISTYDNLKFGILNRETCETATPPTYDFYVSKIYGSMGGIVKGTLGKGTGVFTEEGEEVLPPIFRDVSTSSRDDVCLVKKDDGLWYAASLTNGPIPFAEGYSTISFAPDGGYEVSRGRLHGKLDATGKVLIPVKYDELYFHRKLGLALGRSNGKWHVHGADGVETPFPFECDWADFADSESLKMRRDPGDRLLYRVAKDGKWGIVDSGGNVVLPLAYSYVYPLDKNQYAVVGVGGEWRIDVEVRPRLFGAKWGVWSIDGGIITEPRFDAVFFDRKTKQWNAIERKRLTTMTP